ncbi:MAG TPA: ABC transporter ATP-binding protein [Blastocatellia bacterium]|nr:ABC transporter ATP-binding protein [Blastocatellia bacterium]
MNKRLVFDYLLRPHWKSLLIAFIAVALESVADLMEPWPIKVVLDYVIGQKPPPEWMANFIESVFGRDKLAVLNFAAISVVGIAALGAAASFTEKYLTTKVAQWVMHDLRQTLYHHVQRLSLSFYDRTRTGDLITRVTSDIEAIQDFVQNALLGIVVDVITLAGMLGVMFYLNWQFTLIALAVAPLLFIQVYTLTHKIKRAARAVRQKEGEIVSVIEEALSSIRVVKAFATEGYEERRLERETLESMNIALRARSIKASLSPAVDIIVACGTCVVLWYGARLVMSGGLTAGELVVFLLYLGKMYKPMRDLSKMTDTISKASVGAERIKEIIGVEPERRSSEIRHRRPAPAFKGAIEFENVSFRYQDRGSVLNEVSFKIEPGQFAALVGPTGSGKTTIISLIPRFYDPTSGVVKIDGEDVRSFRLRSLRTQISFVLQDTLLFRGSIWQNIAYGKPEADRDEIVRAATLANAAEFIDKLPEGYDTQVGERGVTLSGGQRQRIAIARAIIRNSPILILDEPTSGLDASSEDQVIEALDRLMQGKTVIIVSHHLSLIRRAGVIFVLKDGRIIERGTHDELIAGAGLYSEFYEIQFRQEEAPEAFSS